uniref:Uncharacterized protein n=1 Tax=Ananas comosus var. bracteatus TaxID=296719 RepID=A0A6V7QE06_ANACO|nr:unnamed protein product [Ananas comosus var. bracteatus]
MPSVAVFSPWALLLLRPRRLLPPSSLSSRSAHPPLPLLRSSKPPRLASSSATIVVAAASSPSFDELDSEGDSPRGSSKKSILLNLIQDIEPLDVSVIQKDVPAETIDAMKRTISGMLGLLPSDQFHVLVEAFWEPLFKLLVSSMTTGYTLRNAEYRLSFERNLELFEEDSEQQETESTEDNSHQAFVDRIPTVFSFSGKKICYMALKVMKSSCVKIWALKD